MFQSAVVCVVTEKGQAYESIPSAFDRLALLVNLGGEGEGTRKVDSRDLGFRSLPMCSCPEYPKYKKGPVEAAESCPVKCKQRGPLRFFVGG